MPRALRGQRGIAVRHGVTVSHVSNVEAASQLMLALACGDASGTLAPFEGLLRSAGAALGLQRTATSEEVRRGLQSRGHDDMAKCWVLARGARRAQAHPDAGVFAKVVRALSRPLLVDAGGSKQPTGLASPPAKHEKPLEFSIGDSSEDGSDSIGVLGHTEVQETVDSCSGSSRFEEAVEGRR